MSCNGCRVLRKGCGEGCVLRPCLQWIESPESQGYATLFVAKFFGRAGLMEFISGVPESERTALFQSLLYEACGRTVNPVYGAVGLLWAGKWHLCQEAVKRVLMTGGINNTASNTNTSANPSPNSANTTSNHPPVHPNYHHIKPLINFPPAPTSMKRINNTTAIPHIINDLISPSNDNPKDHDVTCSNLITASQYNSSNHDQQLTAANIISIADSLHDPRNINFIKVNDDVVNCHNIVAIRLNSISTAMEPEMQTNMPPACIHPLSSSSSAMLTRLSVTHDHDHIQTRSMIKDIAQNDQAAAPLAAPAANDHTELFMQVNGSTGSAQTSSATYSNQCQRDGDPSDQKVAMMVNPNRNHADNSPMQQELLMNFDNQYVNAPAPRLSTGNSLYKRLRLIQRDHHGAFNLHTARGTRSKSTNTNANANTNASANTNTNINAYANTSANTDNKNINYKNGNIAINRATNADQEEINIELDLTLNSCSSSSSSSSSSYHDQNHCHQVSLSLSSSSTQFELTPTKLLNLLV